MFRLKKQMFIVQLLVILVVLSGCGGAEPANTAPTAKPVEEKQVEEVDSGPIELVVWSSDFGLELTEAFEKEHPNVKVIMSDMGWDQELYQNTLNAIQTGNAPDVVVGESYVQRLASEGHLLPLDEVINDLKTDLVPGTYIDSEYEGNVYSIPLFTGVFTLERNCEVVEKAGLDCNSPPTSWDELLEQAKTITEQGEGDYYGYSLQGPTGLSVGSIFRLAVYLEQAGAPICKNSCTEPYFNNPDTIAVLEFIRELNRFTPPGLTLNPDEGQVYTALFEGKSAYQIAGSWHPNWAKDAGCKDCRYSPLPFPDEGEAANKVVGNAVYMVLAQSKHPEMAYEWVKFAASPERQETVFAKSGRLPVSRSALTKLKPEVDEAVNTFIDELLNNPNLAGLPQWRIDPQRTWGVYNELLMDVLTTEKPIEEIIEEAQLNVEKIK
ncbi:extracellular solute-binding protein [Anaerolineales bacterium HSG6]|nr:extracellular solute-binding protein [Anaerolineales bacterium HSG6]